MEAHAQGPEEAVAASDAATAARGVELEVPAAAVTTVGPPGARVPVWLDHVAALGWRLLAAGALAAVVLYIAGLLATVTISLMVVGIVLATTAPLVAGLRARGWSRGRSAAVGWLASMGGITVFAIAAIVAVVPTAADAVRSIAAGIDRIRGELEGAALSPEAVDALAKIGLAVQDWITTNVADVVSSISFLATVGILTFFVTLFAMRDADRAVTWVLQAADDRQRETLVQSGRVAVDRVGAFVRGTSVVGAVRAVATVAILWGLGVPYAAPLAAVVFVGTFVPFIGVIVTTAAILAAAYAAGGAATALAAVGLVVLTYAAAEVLLRPVARARLASLDPVAVLIALPVGSAVAGVLGLLLAVPVALAGSAIAGAVVSALGSEAPGTEGSFVPPWLDRLGQWGWRLLVGIVVSTFAIEAVLYVPFVILPLVLAAVFAATLAPLVRNLVRRGWGETTAALVATGAAVIISGTIMTLTVVALVQQASEIVSTALGGASGVNDALAGAAAALGSAVQSVGSTVTITSDGISHDVAALAVAIVLSVLLCFFFLRDGPRTWHALSDRLRPWRRDEADVAAAKAVDVLGGYMLATGVISAFGAVTQWAIMFVLGLPLALPLAVLSFFGGFIPYIGSFITTGIALLVTIAVGSPTDIAVMVAFTLIFNIVTGNIVAPLVYGRAINIHPAIVLMAIPAGGAIGGILGMFLVVPIIGIVAATWRTVLRVFGDPPPGVGPDGVRTIGRAPGTPGTANADGPDPGDVLPRSTGEATAGA